MEFNLWKGEPNIPTGKILSSKGFWKKLNGVKKKTNVIEEGEPQA